MAGPNAAAIGPAIMCFGAVILIGTAVVVVPSLISVFTPDGSEAGFGSEYAFDAIMLKFIFYNETSGAFENGSVTYNSDISRLCTTQYSLQSAPNFIACLLYNGRVFAPYNTSTNSRRRRALTSGMYYTGEGRVYFSDTCPAAADKNKTDNASSISNCVKTRLGVCNNIINRIAGVLTQWTVTSPIVISATNSSGNASDAQITAVYGVPSNIAVSLAQSLGLRPGIIASLQVGCRYVGQKSISDINSAIAAIVSG